ncbi:MAG: PEP/pyruvate-binding domain-containing protein [Candidatus Omnitrophota bacterium]
MAAIQSSFNRYIRSLSAIGSKEAAVPGVAQPAPVSFQGPGEAPGAPRGVEQEREGAGEAASAQLDRKKVTEYFGQLVWWAKDTLSTNVNEANDDFEIRVMILEAAAKNNWPLRSVDLGGKVKEIKKLMAQYRPDIAALREKAVQETDPARREQYLQEYRNAMGEFINSLFASAVIVKNGNMVAGERLLAELKNKPASEWPWAITEYEREEVLRNIDTLMREVPLDAEAFYFGTEYRLSKGLTNEQLQEEIRVRLYLQAVHMTYNRTITSTPDHGTTTIPERMGAGELGNMITMYDTDYSGGDKLARLGKFLRYVAYYRELEKSLGLPVHATDPEVGGFVMRMIDRPDGLEYIARQLKDIKAIEDISMEANGRYISMPNVFAALYAAREEGEDALTWAQKNRFRGRISVVDPNNFSTYLSLDGKENYAYVLAKWRNVFGRILTPEELTARVNQMNRLEELIREKMLPAGATPTAEQQALIDSVAEYDEALLIENLKSVHDGFTRLVAPSLYTTVDGNLLDSISPQLAAVDSQMSKFLPALIVGGQERSLERDDRSSCNLIFVRVIGEFSSVLAKERTDRVGTRQYSTQQLNELRARFVQYAEEAGVQMDTGEADYLVQEMLKGGYTEREIVFKYITLRDRVGDIYRRIYLADGSPQTAEDVRAITGLTGTLIEKFDFLYTDNMVPALQRIKELAVEDLTLRVNQEGLPASQKTELEERLRIITTECDLTTEAGVNRMIDFLLAQELGNLRSEMELAKTVEDEFKRIGIDIARDDAESIGHAAFMGAVTREDLVNWVNTIKLVKDQMVSLGVSVSDKKIMYTVDTWFGLGVTKPLVKENVSRAEVEAAVDSQLARLVKELNLDESPITREQRDAIVKQFMEANMQPSMMRLLVDEVIRLHRALAEARRSMEARDGLRDLTAAPRAKYDIESFVSVKDLLVYVDEQNTNPSEHIGLMAIFGFERDTFEKKKTRAITAMFKTQEDIVLMSLLKDVWYNRLSALEKGRYNLYEWLKNNKVYSTLLFVGSLLAVVIIPLLAYLSESIRKAVRSVKDKVMPSGSSPEGKPVRPRPSIHISKGWVATFIGLAAFGLFVWKIAIPFMVSTPILLVPFVVAAVITFLYGVFTRVHWAVHPPWEGLTQPVGAELEQFKPEVERNILLRQHLPFKLAVTFFLSLLTTTVISTVNLNVVNWFVLSTWGMIFVYLVMIIIDIYLLKLLIFIIGCIFKIIPDLKEPLRDEEIIDSKSFAMINPLRPVNEEQLINVIRKNIAVLKDIRSPNVVGILILQAVGNDAGLYKRYYDILKEEVYENPEFENRQDIKDRFYVFCMKGIAKPHNMYKVFRWLYREDEKNDPVTKGFIFGVKTNDLLPTAVTIGEDRVPHIGEDAGRYGIVATQGGLENLHRLRGGEDGKPIIANGSILDADNYATSDMVRRMINTMSDRYMVWQPRIEFYNAPQTLYAYVMKQTPNNALGIFSQTASTLTEGGVRSFGKYFFRINPYYRVEVAGNQFQSMYLPDRGYLQSEDAYHGIFGRVGFVPKAIIYENTPSNYMSELEREETKWLPTFDIRNFIYLHGPWGMGGFFKWQINNAERLKTQAKKEGNNLAGMEAFLKDKNNKAIIVDQLHIKIDAYEKAVEECEEAIKAVVANNPEQTRTRYNGAFTFLRDTVASSIRRLPEDERKGYDEFYKKLELQLRPKEEIVQATIDLLKLSDKPKLPLRGEYSESLVTRGIISEPIWTLQLLLTFYAMLFPGTLEMAFPFIGEMIFLGVMLLLTHPKFTGPLINYIFGIVEPPFKPFGTSRIGKVFNGLFSFIAHDIPIGVFELVASTTVYLMKLVIKPLELYKGFKGTRAELLSHAAGQKSAGTWPSFLETTANPPIIDYLMKFRWAPAIGLSIFLLASSGTPLAATMHITTYVAWGISVIMAFMLGAWPAIINWRKTNEILKTEKDYLKIKELKTARLVFVLASTILSSMILVSGFFAPLVKGFIPIDLVLRASTIFIAAFMFGPGAAWLMATPRGERVEGTFNPPVFKSGTRNLAILFGLLFILAAAYLLFAGIPNIADYPVLATIIPTGDGSSGVFLPAFGTLLRLPWQFSIFFNVIIGGAVVIGTVGYVWGVGEYIYRITLKKRTFYRILNSDETSQKIIQRYEEAVDKADKAMIEYVKKEILISLCEEVNYYLDDLAVSAEAKRVWENVKSRISETPQPQAPQPLVAPPSPAQPTGDAQAAQGLIDQINVLDAATAQESDVDAIAQNAASLPDDLRTNVNTAADAKKDAIRTRRAGPTPSPIVIRAGEPEGRYEVATAKVTDNVLQNYRGVDNGMQATINALLQKAITLEGVNDAVKAKVTDLLGNEAARKELLKDKTIRIVQGNDRLMHFAEAPDMITIDIEALKYEELLFLEFIHELLHAKLAATPVRAGPIDEEIQISTQEVELLLLFPQDVQARILETLKADNDLDDQQFFKILEKAQTQGMAAVKQEVSDHVLSNLPQQGIGSRIAASYKPEDYEVVVMAQDGYSGRMLYDGQARRFIVDGTPAPYNENALAVRAPIKDYIDKYKAANPGREIVAVIPHGNSMTNEWFVTFAGGKLYYPWGERYQEKTYPCFVTWKDGHVSVEDLRFEQDTSGAITVKIAASDTAITSDIISAVSGQQIVKNGQAQDIAGSALYDKFTDVKQIFLYPRFKYAADGRDMFFGMDQMYKNQDLFRKVFAGEFIEFSKADLVNNNISDDAFRTEMRNIGYREGEDYIVAHDNIRIRVKLNPYSHNLIGVKADGTIVAITCPGDSQKHIGITIADLQKFVIDNGVKDVIMLSNGSDIQVRNADNNKLVASANARDTAPTVILIVRKDMRDQYSRAIQAGSIQGTFDFFYRITDLGKLKDIKGGAAWQLADGSYMDQLTHVREVVHASEMIADNNYDYFNQRRYPKDGKEFDRGSFAKVKAAYDELMGDAYYREILQVFIALHDYGKIWGEDHYINGAREIVPLLRKIGMDEGKIRLIQALILRHSDFGELYIGESVPAEDIKFLTESGFDIDKFQKLQLILHVCDVNSVGQGRLTANQLEDFLSYVDINNLQRIQGNWWDLRLKGLMGIESMSVEIAGSMALLTETEQGATKEFLNNIKLRRYAFLVRGLDHKNVLPFMFLNLQMARLARDMTGRSIDFMWSTSDRVSSRFNEALSGLSLDDLRRARLTDIKEDEKYVKATIVVSNPGITLTVPLMFEEESGNLIVDTEKAAVEKVPAPEQPIPVARAEKEEQLEIADVGSVGTQNEEYKQRHTRPRIENDIVSGRYVRLIYENGELKIDNMMIGKNASAIDTDLMKRIIGLNADRSFKRFFRDRGRSISSLSLYLLEPSDALRTIQHPHLLTVVGKQFEIAASGTNQGAEQAIYITRRAFTDLNIDLIRDVLKTQVLMAVARYNAWHSAQPRPIGEFTPEMHRLLERVRTSRIIKEEIKDVNKYDIRQGEQYSFDIHTCEDMVRYLGMIKDKMPDFAPAITNYERSEKFLEAMRNYDFDTAIEYWGYITYEFTELQTRSDANSRRFLVLPETRLFLALAGVVNELFENYILRHGVYNQNGEEYGKAVGRIRVISDVNDIDKEFANAKGDEIWVIPYLPFRRPDIPGAGCIVSIAGNRHAVDTAKAQAIPLAVIPNAMEMLKGLDNYIGMLRVEKDRDVRFRIAFNGEKGVPRKKGDIKVVVPKARVDSKVMYDLSEIDRNFVSFAGTKAATLGDMMNAGIAVPEGKVLTFAFWNKFKEFNNMDQKIAAIREKIKVDGGKVLTDEESLKVLLNDIKKVITEGNFPAELAGEVAAYIKDAQARYGDIGFYVRSSFNFEDLTERTMAGHYESYPDKDFLDTSTPEKVLEAVKLVFASMWNEVAFRARVNDRVADEDVMPAVVIQVPVKARMAGTMYTANSYSYSRNEIDIMASLGQGAAVVGGHGRPAEVILNKITGEIKVLQGHSWVDMAYLFIDGTFQLRYVTTEEREEKLLSTDIIRQLGALGEKIEGLYDFRPQDIEWCVDRDGKVWIVQSRAMQTEQLPTEKMLDDEVLKMLGNQADEALLLKLMSARKKEDIAALFESLHLESTIQDLLKDRKMWLERLIAASYLSSLADDEDFVNRISVEYVEKLAAFLRKAGAFQDMVSITNVLAFTRKVSVKAKSGQVKSIMKGLVDFIESLDSEAMIHTVNFEMIKLLTAHQKYEGALPKFRPIAGMKNYPDIADRSIMLLNNIPGQGSIGKLREFVDTREFPDWIREYARRLIDRLEGQAPKEGGLAQLLAANLFRSEKANWIMRGLLAPFFANIGHEIAHLTYIIYGVLTGKINPAMLSNLDLRRDIFKGIPIEVRGPPALLGIIANLIFGVAGVIILAIFGDMHIGIKAYFLFFSAVNFGVFLAELILPISKEYRYKSDLYKALGPVVLVGIPQEMAVRPDVISAIKNSLGRQAQIVTVYSEDELAVLAKQRDMTAVFVDKDFTVEAIKTEKFRNDVYSIKLAKEYNVIIGMNTISARTREEIKESIIALLGKLAAVDFDRAVKEFRGTNITAEKLQQIDNIRTLVARRKAEIKSIYNNAPLPTAAEVKKRVGVATTEKVAMSDMYFGENMGIANNAGIKNAFIYGDELKNEEEARKFVLAAGYTGRMEDIAFINKGSLTYEQLAAEVAKQAGIGQENVGIRSVSGELKLEGDKVTTGVLLEVEPITMNGERVYVAINSYQALLRLLTAEGEIEIPGVSKDDVKGIFRYLPRTVPIDYEKEIKGYIEAIAVIRTAA